MNKYYVTIPWHAGVTIEVEAKNKKDALAVAECVGQPNLCHHCSDAVNLDGGPNYDVEWDICKIDKPEVKRG